MRFHPTKVRGVVALAAAATTVLASIAVAAWLSTGVIAKALILLVVSISGFHAAAWFAFERKQAWLVLDYALEAVTVVSLFAAVAGIQQSAVSAILQGEFARRKAEQASLVYYIKSTITNDATPRNHERTCGRRRLSRTLVHATGWSTSCRKSNSPLAKKRASRQ